MDREAVISREGVENRERERERERGPTALAAGLLSHCSFDRREVDW